jgi:predicted phosphodiesterase
MSIFNWRRAVPSDSGRSGPPPANTRQTLTAHLVPFIAEELARKKVAAADTPLVLQRLQPGIRNELERIVAELGNQRSAVLRYIIQLLGLDRNLSAAERRFIDKINRQSRADLDDITLAQLFERVEKGDTIVEEKDIVLDENLERCIYQALQLESEELHLTAGEILEPGRESRQERLAALHKFLQRHHQDDLYHRWARDWQTSPEEEAEKQTRAPADPGNETARKMFSLARRYYDTGNPEHNQKLLTTDLRLMAGVMKHFERLEKNRVVTFTFKNEDSAQDGEIYIIGDLHGCLCNLEAALSPGQIDFFNRVQENPRLKLFFLGDYVDRGLCSTETLRLIWLLKNRYPENIYLLQGNHDTHSIHELDGSPTVQSDAYPADFHEIYCDYLGIDYFTRLAALEQKMPVAFFLETKEMTIMLCHGGIVRDHNLDQITSRQALAKPHLTREILWSDPNEHLSEVNNQVETRFCFSRQSAETFLDKVGADLIIRGHEAVETGYQAIWDTKLITIFSAGGPGNFCAYGNYENVTPHYLSLQLKRGKFIIEPHEILYQAYAKSYQQEYEEEQ